MAPAVENALALEPFPGDLRAPQPAVAQGKRKRERSRKPLPRHRGHGTDSAAADEVRPEGDIPIHDLYLPGVYAGRVEAWFAAADAATAAL
eukprot:4949407-Pleurochrysis_carterae.AAC.1